MVAARRCGAGRPRVRAGRRAACAGAGRRARRRGRRAARGRGGVAHRRPDRPTARLAAVRPRTALPGLGAVARLARRPRTPYAAVFRWVPTVPGYVLAIAGILTLVDRAGCGPGPRVAVEVALFLGACLVMVSLLVVGPAGRWAALGLTSGSCSAPPSSSPRPRWPAALTVLGVIEARRRPMAVVLLVGTVLLTAGPRAGHVGDALGTPGPRRRPASSSPPACCCSLSPCSWTPGRAPVRAGDGRRARPRPAPAAPRAAVGGRAVGGVALAGVRPSAVTIAGARRLRGPGRGAPLADRPRGAAARRAPAAQRVLLPLAGPVRRRRRRHPRRRPAHHLVLPGARPRARARPPPPRRPAAARVGAPRRRPAPRRRAAGRRREPGRRTADSRPAHRSACSDATGEWRYLEAGVSDLRGDPDVGAVVLHCRDMTERHAREQALQSVAYTDPMTGLPNRAGCCRRCRRPSRAPRRRRRRC